MNNTTQNPASRRLLIIEEKIRLFSRNNKLCALFHYVTGILAIVLSGVVAMKASFLQNPHTFEVVSIVSFLLVTIITFVAPSRLAAAWGAGGRRMEVEYYRFQNDPDYPAAKVFDAYEEAEMMINRIEAMSTHTNES